MVLPYNPTSPEETEKLKVSQPKIVENFGSIKTIIEENHVAFGLNDQGAHKYVVMPNAAVPATPAENSTDLNLFARTDTGANFPQLWLQYPNADVVQLTGNNTGSTGTSGTGWSKFPSGIIMKWGTATVTQNVPGRFVFYPVGPNIPAFTKNPSYLKVTPTENRAGTFNTFYTVAGYGTDRFFLGEVITFPITINWFAIGV